MGKRGSPAKRVPTGGRGEVEKKITKAVLQPQKRKRKEPKKKHKGAGDRLKLSKREKFREKGGTASVGERKFRARNQEPERRLEKL